ncbi:hypothetical protein Tco_1403817 [Tanacetum coccineum]
MMKDGREKANDQIEKFYEIFRDLSFEISFTDALMLMPKFASTLKTLIGNKEKLSEMARTPLNENCSAITAILHHMTGQNRIDALTWIVKNTLKKFLVFKLWIFLLSRSRLFSCYRDDPTSPEVEVPTYYDPDGDVSTSKQFLNSDPSPPPPNQGNYFLETRKDLKICEANSLVNEPPEVELKDLPPHLEYAFLEGNDKLPVIIAKDFKE